MKDRIEHGKNFRRTVFNIAVTLVIGFIYFYVKLPAINLHNPGLYGFRSSFWPRFYCFLALIGSGLSRSATAGEIIDGIKGAAAFPPYICVSLADRVIYPWYRNILADIPCKSLQGASSPLKRGIFRGRYRGFLQ
jgi:hypothetical protein